jgi:hypothetical protein
MRSVLPPSPRAAGPVRLGDSLLDRYLEFVESRALNRPGFLGGSGARREPDRRSVAMPLFRLSPPRPMNLAPAVRSVVHDGRMDRFPRPEAIDEALWVVIGGGEDRCYILGNGHTFAGRISAWSDTIGRGFSFSKGEVVDASDLARAWIDGFLSGNGCQLAGPTPTAVDEDGIGS